MTGRFKRTRTITSKRAMDDRKTRPDFNEIAKRFTSSLEMQVKSNHLDLDISMKAAPKPKKSKPMKSPRKKLGKSIWSVGGVRIDKSRRGILGMRFKPYVTASELRGQSDKPNIGWVNPPIGLSPEAAKKYLARIHFGDGKKKINLKHRDVKADPRTGNVSVKSLGDSLDEIQPLAGVGVRAAARSGVVVDSAGRFRCPPGVPAANQFTDKMGSNCFDITPQNKRRAIEESVRKAAGFLSQIHIANTVEDSLPEDASQETVESAIRNLNIPQSQADSVVEIAAKRKAILDEVARIEESAISQIRKTDPNFTEMTRSENGLVFDNDPIKVAKSSILALQEANPDLDLSGLLWTGVGGRSGTKPANLEEAIDTHIRAVAENIWDQLFGTTEIGPDGNPVFKTLSKAELNRKARMIDYAMNFQGNTGATFVGDSGLFNRALAGYMAKEQGFLYGMLDMANTSPDLFSKFSQVVALNPDSNESDFAEVEAKAWVDEAGNFIMYWNPMLLMRQGRGYGRPLISDGEYRVFEPAEDSVDAMESAILDEISNAADLDSRRLAINKLFNHKYDKTVSGSGYWGALVDEFGGERAQSMYAISHEVGHHLTFDIGIDVINSTALDGEFENVEEALYDVLFGGEVTGLLPDILEIFENQSTRDVMNALSENGLGGKMPLDYMKDVKIFSELSDAFNSGGVEKMQESLDSIYSSGLMRDSDLDMWLDRCDSLIAGTDKEATQFMRDWKVQQQAVVAELISELRAARQFGLVDATDPAVSKSLRAIDIKEAEIAAGKSARRLEKEAKDSVDDIRGISSRRMSRLLEKAKDGLNEGSPGWLVGKTPEELAEAIVPDSKESLISLMAMSKFKTKNPDAKQLKMINKRIDKEFGGIDNIDFDPKSVGTMRKRMTQTFNDFPEFSRVVQRFGAPPFITAKDFFKSSVGTDASSTGGFYGVGSRSIMLNPGIAGTNGYGKGLLGFVKGAAGTDSNGWAQLVSDVLYEQDNPFAGVAIHEYGHWLSFSAMWAENGTKEDIRHFLDAGLDEESVKAITSEHGADGIFNMFQFAQLSALHQQLFDEEVKVNRRNAAEIAQKIFNSNDFDTVKANADVLDIPMSLSSYAISGGSQENWAEGFTAVITGNNRMINDAMKDAVNRIIGEKNDYERSIFAAFNSRRSKTKPAEISDVKKRSLSRLIKNRDMKEDEIGAVVELEKANELIKNNEPHAALAILSAEASEGSGPEVLDQALEKISTDGALIPKEVEKLERLTRAISDSPNGASTSEIFMGAKYEADRMDASFKPPASEAKQEGIDRSINEMRGIISENSIESTLAGDNVAFSTRKPVREVLEKDGFVPDTRQDSIRHLLSARSTLLNSLDESEKTAVTEATRDLSAVLIPSTLDDIKTMINNSIKSKKYGENYQVVEGSKNRELASIINDLIVPFNNVVSRTELGQRYRTQMNLRVNPETGINLAEGDIIDIPNHFRSDVLSSDSGAMDAAVGFSSRRYIPRDQWIEQQRAGGMHRDSNGTYWRMTGSGIWTEWDEPVDDEPRYQQRRRPTVKAPGDSTDLIRDARQIDNDFVRSVVGQFDDRGSLTTKQWDALRRTVERDRKINPNKFAKDTSKIVDGLPKAPDEIEAVGKDGSAKVIILAHETDKGIPDVVGDEPELHTTAITMPPTRLKVEYIGEDGTVYVSVDEQNHIDPSEKISDLLEQTGDNLTEAQRTEVAIAKTTVQGHKKPRLRGFSSSRNKIKSNKTGFPKYQEEAASFKQADDVVSRQDIRPESQETRRILQNLESAGAKFAQPASKEYLDVEDKNGFGRGSIPYQRRVDYHKRSTFNMFDAIRARSSGEEFYTSDANAYGSRDFSSEDPANVELAKQSLMNMAKDRQTYLNNLFDALPQSVVEHINSRTNDELMDDLKTAAAQFNDGLDRRVRVRVKSPYLRKFAESGEYKTTHNDGIISEHSQAHGRKSAEVQFGIPSSAPDELRPASGYVMHKDSISAVEDHARSKIAEGGDEAILGEFFDWDSYSGSSEFDNRVGIYGGIEILLNDDVAHRTAITGGDSLNGWHNPSMLGESDPEKILMSLAAPIHHDSSNLQAQNISLLRSFLEQDYKYAARLENGKNDVRNIYHEALVAGSFRASEVAEIRAKHSDLSFHDRTTRSQMLDRALIDSLNLSDSEMAIIEPYLEKFLENGNSNQYIKGHGTMLLPTKDITDLAAYLNHAKMIKQLEGNGFNGRLIRTNRNGVDLMDPSVYSGYRPGMTVEQILRKRLATSMKAEIKKLLDSNKSKQKELVAGDF